MQLAIMNIGESLSRSRTRFLYANLLSLKWKLYNFSVSSLKTWYFLLEQIISRGKVFLNQSMSVKQTMEGIYYIIKGHSIQAGCRCLIEISGNTFTYCFPTRHTSTRWRVLLRSKWTPSCHVTACDHVPHIDGASVSVWIWRTLVEWRTLGRGFDVWRAFRWVVEGSIPHSRAFVCLKNDIIMPVASC